MANMKISQKVIVPLFNVELAEPMQFSIGEHEFADKKTAHVYPEPIRIKQKWQQISDSDFTSIPAPPPIPLPVPLTTVFMLPWNPSDPAARDELQRHCPSVQLPEDFDVFDNLGSVALRSGSSGGAGFRTMTTLTTKTHASGILVIEFCQGYPVDIPSSMRTFNPYEPDLTDSFLDSLRLYTVQEPAQFKAFHFLDNKMLDVVTKWPLTEIHGPRMKLNISQIGELKKVFFQIWRIRVGAGHNIMGYSIINFALEYYYLSSTMSQTRTIFLYLMIAFEALFKFPNEDSSSAACSRISKLVARTKAEKNEIHAFLWSNKAPVGCCQIRNFVAHGQLIDVPQEIFWKLKYLLRGAIATIAYLTITSQINPGNYYGSMDTFVRQRFEGLPNE